MAETLVTIYSCAHGAKFRVGGPDQTMVAAAVEFPCGCTETIRGLLRASQQPQPAPSKFARKVRPMDFAPKS